MTAYEIIGISIAILAFIRPEIEKIFQYIRFHIELYPANWIELGHSTFGSTIGLRGSLFCFNYNTFISNIYLDIKTPSGESHRFEWAFFKNEKIVKNTQSAGDDISVELAMPFNLMANIDKKISIIFINDTMKREISNDLTKLKDSFYKKMGIVDFNLHAIQNSASHHMERLKKFQEYYSKNTQEINKNILDIKEKCLWKEGDYEISINIKLSNTKKNFSKKYKTYVQNEDFEKLKNNSESIIKETLGIITSQLYFANTEIKNK